MWRTQLFEFSGTLPTTGFNIGNTLTYAGENRIIVNRFLNAQNQITAVAVRAGAEDGNTIQFSPGLSASDGNGNTGLVISSVSALNYYFSLNQAGPYENIRNFTFQKNKRYIFNQANSSNNTHPIRFSTTPDGIHTLLSGQGAQADFGDPYDGDEVNYQYTSVDVSIIPNDNTPTTLYYYCSNGFGNPINEHINEGGFDGKEGSITISGEATVAGGNLSITVAQVDTESNIILNKDGTATLGTTTASSLTLTGNIAIGGAETLSGNLTIGSNKFTVDSLNGDTFIAGSLTVDADLAFLADAELGSTLYIDSTNNRVSVNVDPDITPLTKSFEVLGDAKISDNVILASSVQSTLKVGNSNILSQGSRLQVDGNIYSNSKYYAEADGDVTKPVYTFDSLERVGLSADPTRNSLSVTTTTGECLTVEPQVVNFLRNADFNKLEVLTSSIIPGEGYEIGSYSGVEFVGGTGSGFFGDVIVAFVGNISNVGSGYVDGEYIANFSGGSGLGASLSFTVVDNEVENIVVTNGGTGYLVGDILTINPNTITNNQNQLVTFTPTDDAEYTITFLGAVTVVNPNISGEGYISGDELTFKSNSDLFVNQSLPSNYFPWLPEQSVLIGDLLYYQNKLYEVTLSGDTAETQFPPSHITGTQLNGTSELTFVKYIKFSYIIDTTDTLTTVSINKDDGDVLSESITTNLITVGNQLSINANQISSTQNQDIVITPGAASKLLSIAGSGGVKVPVGNSTNRPSASTLGIIRYNSQTQQYEGSNGSNFISLGGVRDVDGNTYIIAEEETGANDNILYFFNDADNSARLNRNELELVTATTISSKDTDGKFKWKENTSYLLNAFIYYDTNLYQVTTAGTTGSNAPTHTVGIEPNGTAQLTYVSNTYGDLILKANNITFDGQLTLGGSLQLYTLNNALILENTSDAFKFAFGDNTGTPNTFASITDSGSLLINKNYNTLNPENNLTVLDYSGKFIELEDIKILTFDLSLVKGATETGNITVYDPDLCKGAKVIIVAENITSGDTHIVEYNIISKGSDIYVNEYGNLDTGLEQYQVEWLLSPGGNIQGNVSLSSALTASDMVIITASITQIKK